MEWYDIASRPTTRVISNRCNFKPNAVNVNCIHFFWVQIPIKKNGGNLDITAPETFLPVVSSTWNADSPTFNHAGSCSLSSPNKLNLGLNKETGDWISDLLTTQGHLARRRTPHNDDDGNLDGRRVDDAPDRWTAQLSHRGVGDACLQWLLFRLCVCIGVLHTKHNCTVREGSIDLREKRHRLIALLQKQCIILTRWNLEPMAIPIDNLEVPNPSNLTFHNMNNWNSGDTHDYRKSSTFYHTSITRNRSSLDHSAAAGVGWSTSSGSTAGRAWMDRYIVLLR